MSKDQLEREEQENRGEPSFRTERTQRTKGSEGVDSVMAEESSRLRALMMTESGTMEVSALSKEVSWASLRERVSAGPI